MTMSAHAIEQGRLWGSDPEGWVEFGESQNIDLFEAVLDAADVHEGTKLLDVGCGVGGAVALAAARGAIASGLDVSEPLLATARRRLQSAQFVLGEADVLPWPDESFDAVIGINSFQFAASHHVALGEAARVVAAGGCIVATLFAAPERSQATVIHHALSALTTAAGQQPNAPYALSAPGALEAGLAEAGLEVAGGGEVECAWEYPDTEAVVRGILSSAGGARALWAAGRTAAASAIVDAVEPYTDADGSVRLINVFRWVKAIRP